MDARTQAVTIVSQLKPKEPKVSIAQAIIGWLENWDPNQNHQDEGGVFTAPASSTTVGSLVVGPTIKSIHPTLSPVPWKPRPGLVKLFYASGWVRDDGLGTQQREQAIQKDYMSHTSSHIDLFPFIISSDLHRRRPMSTTQLRKLLRATYRHVLRARSRDIGLRSWPCLFGRLIW